MDNIDFDQDLSSIAIRYSNLIQKFEIRINDMVIREKITDIYLRNRLRKLSKDVANLRAEISKDKMKILISYSHLDEAFKNDLVTMLAGLQRQGIIDAWQYRCIQPGNEWLKEIYDAMEDCNLALLLISPDFIASRFVQEKELVYLFQKRVVEGLRVIPVIVRPCLWQSEPVIKDLQVLPKDGKPVISFAKDNGDRDQVWTDIGKVIEKFAKEKRWYRLCTQTAKLGGRMTALHLVIFDILGRRAPVADVEQVVFGEHLPVEFVVQFRIRAPSTAKRQRWRPTCRRTERQVSQRTTRRTRGMPTNR